MSQSSDETHHQPTRDLPTYGNGAFEQLVGDSTKSRTLRFLVEHNQSHRQQDIAEAIDRTQPIVSRALADFEELGLLERKNGGVRLHRTDTVHLLAEFMDDISRRE